ncbi:macrophage mannose receptor 1 [Genypterus blacodes]|uniref:macrophage mannose receptor 1 n=1 Tax=Genypterus blacodes TaxID=154954 RepID=UPI003F767964
MRWRLSLLLLLIGYCALTRCRARQYHFIRDVLPWLQAQSHCRGNYTDLATVDNIEEMNQLVNTTLTSQGSAGDFRGKAWIGLHRGHQWSDLSTSSFQNWRSGQPDNVTGVQGCVAADMGNAGLWSDENCNRTLSFVCYGEKNETKQVSPSTTVTPNQRATTGPLSTEVSRSDQLSIPLLRQTQKHFVQMKVRLTTTIDLSENDIRELMLAFRNFLSEHGLSESVRMTVLKSSAEKHTG